MLPVAMLGGVAEEDHRHQRHIARCTMQRMQEEQCSKKIQERAAYLLTKGNRPNIYLVCIFLAHRKTYQK